MEADNQIEIIKPLIFPPCYSDESAVGFLTRVAALNGYRNYRWLIKRGIVQADAASPFQLYSSLCELQWTRFFATKPMTHEIHRLGPRLLTTNKLKYCPVCLLERAYWQAGWQLKYSLTCSIHKVWLRDTCPICKNILFTPGISLGGCMCGARITDSEIEFAPVDILLWQDFLEGSLLENSNGFPLLLGPSSVYTLDERVKAAQFFLRWARKTQVNVQKNLNFLSISSPGIRHIFLDAAEIIFSGRAGYRAFLLKLLTNTDNPQKTAHAGFIAYYRDFNKTFIGEKFSQLKKITDEFVGSEWKKSVCRRNRSFSTEILMSHQWIPFQVACRKYGIHRSVLRRAILDFGIDHKVSDKKSREFIDIFEPDLIRKLVRIKDCITSKEALLILGVTKLQFLRIRDSGRLKDVAPPKKGHCAEWQFSRDEILQYMCCLTASATPPIGDVFTLAEVFKYYGGKIEDPIINLLDALDSGQLLCRGTSAKAKGIRALLLDRVEFFHWYARYKRNSELMTIVQAAKILGVNQELTYQLVNRGLLGYEMIGDDPTKWISESHMKSFHSTYVFLSKISKALETSTRKLMAFLKSHEVFPVDHGQQWKLRQKVYFRADLLEITIFDTALAVG